MTHPLIPAILELATPVAAELDLEVVGAVFHTHQSPPVLRVDIRNPVADTSLTDCERMSLALEATLDETGILPDAYVLEISSPGVSRQLTSDREFMSFRGFPVSILTEPPLEGKAEWTGNLISRDDVYIYLNQKGRKLKIPRDQVSQVQLQDGD